MWNLQMVKVEREIVRGKISKKIHLETQMVLKPKSKTNSHHKYINKVHQEINRIPHHRVSIRIQLNKEERGLGRSQSKMMMNLKYQTRSRSLGRIDRKLTEDSSNIRLLTSLTKEEIRTLIDADVTIVLPLTIMENLP
jgi:hypothetical protein